MSKWRCNSCGATYNDPALDGAPYFHACSPEVIEHGTHDAEGKQVVAEKRTPRENIRNEHTRSDLVLDRGKYFVRVGSAQLESGEKLIPVDSPIISEGLGRTLIE
jgi:hypothetical protein